MDSHHQSNSDTSLTHRKKRRKLSHHTHTSTSSNGVVNTSKFNTTRRWRTQSEQQIYSSKLLEALRQSRRSSTSTSTISPARKIRETADKVLAISAKGKTKWSRAILAGRRIRLKVKKARKAKLNNGGEKKKETISKNRKLPPVEKKVRILSRLVPGCRKASFCNILEEASDYIAALKMQVKAMTALTETLSGGASSSGGGIGGFPVDHAS